MSAQAGAFLQEPGHGQIISQLGFSEAGRAYDAYGRIGAIPAWRKFELTTYAEYGLMDWLTVIGSPSWFSFRAPTPTPSNWFGPPLGDQTVKHMGAAEAGARVGFAEWGDAVLSVQATARYAAGGQLVEPYVDMGRRTQIDLRLLYGDKIELLGFDGYVDAQAAFRTRGPLGNQIRLDMTAAVRPFAWATLMLQSFTSITPGRLGANYMLQQKAQASIIVDITDNLSFQIGALVALRGVNSAAEKGLVSGVWLKF